MRKKLETQLFHKYPLILQEHGCADSGMSRGIECGDGWFSLIDTLYASLPFDVNQNALPQVVARQLKEKFGGLRFYFRGGSEYSRGMVAMATAFSQNICDQCGRPGVCAASQDGIATRCAGHMLS